ncbi:MAG TPA: helix-turn-helix transcriptional regulator, partial [Pseudonocardiaceae bacterium]|nr:helix-turn-helix transcriptional regulator [Pseudonocardiaceae bacterium]
AAALLARNATGDHIRARRAARDADTAATALGMTAYVERTAELVARLRRVVVPTQLSARQVEVAELVADGLTDRQIARRLAISERTAHNHVQHILAKLGFADRDEIAVWRVSSRG